MHNVLLVLASWLVAGLLAIILGWLRKSRKSPRTLVSKYPIGIGDSRVPCGIVSIDGVEIREGDNVILTRQTSADLNGRWVASSGSWNRYHQLSHELGDWSIATHGSNAGTLWVCASDTTWSQVTTGRTLLPIHSSDFAPTNPVEAAAYLYSLGVPPPRLTGSRNVCINYLVDSGDILRYQGELLRMKPENLVSYAFNLSGQRVRLLQSWTDQVRMYLNGMIGFTTQLEAQVTDTLRPTSTPFTRVPLTGFQRIKGNQPETPPAEPERRSRYGREPVI